MTQIANQLLLPLCLAFIMLIMGMNLRPADFKALAKSPKASLLGLVAQLLLLPLLAWLLIMAMRLPMVLAAGLILVASAPGGATSNLFSHLAGGDLALSVALTAVVSLLAPLWMPLAVGLQLGWLGFEASFALSYRVTVLQLAMVTLLPVLLGMLWRFWASDWVLARQIRLKQLSSGLLMLMILTLLLVNQQALPGFLSLTALAVVVLASLALAMGLALGRLFRLAPAQAVTLAFETGVQNAATAMMVAFGLLAAPELAMVALLYGVLMNLPAFVALWWLKPPSAAVQALAKGQ